MSCRGCWVVPSGGDRGAARWLPPLEEALVRQPPAHLTVSPRLQQIAFEHRQAPTVSEQKLSSALRARQLGVQFRRQVPLAGRFVVEVDGSSHELRRRADARRDRVLERLGYRVLRLDAELVMHALPEDRGAREGGPRTVRERLRLNRGGR